ncbi:HD-GYP domain-containing protein [Massilia scottii]|uniref:HD-GYP domain-containing protein n=1 Tax=Massilia scottii TaxID=3057166 RepID=UPI002796720B|nr:HD domain-containing phosphohydrolase [Massilia sp. CCM 9029]MDQ1830321.1 HD domain-containing phosphohydrolase [Massilia sp. CCM 9029]
MAIRRITLADLAFGEPLRWDIFSTPSSNRPLLQKGQVLAPGQLDDWIEAGLYAEASSPVSVLQSLNQINRRLERTLMDLRDQGSADRELRAIAQDLIDTVERGADVALAAIFLNQIAGAYAVRHCTEAAVVACLIAHAMYKAPAEVLVITAAALSMNVGMVRQADLFQNKDGALSHEERALVRRHPSASVDMLRFAGVSDEAWLDLVLLHHENDDGSGYPAGKLGDEISQNAKLIGLADRYCAFVSARNYRRSLLPPVALERLCAGNEMPYDQIVLGHFATQIGAYPPGTLVRLENAELGVVSRRDEDGAGMAVHVLRAADGKALAEAQQRVTTQPGCAIAEALHEDHAKLRFPMKQIWGELASL